MSAIYVKGNVVGCQSRTVNGPKGAFQEHKIWIVDPSGNSEPVAVKSLVGPRTAGDDVEIPVWLKRWTSKAGNHGVDLVEVKTA